MFLPPTTTVSVLPLPASLHLPPTTVANLPVALLEQPNVTPAKLLLPHALNPLITLLLPPPKNEQLLFSEQLNWPPPKKLSSPDNTLQLPPKSAEQLPCTLLSIAVPMNDTQPSVLLPEPPAIVV